MPKTVAQLTISADVGASFFDSMLRSPAAASELALVSCGCVIGLSARIVQPPRLFWLVTCSRLQRALGDHRVRRRRADRQLALLLHHGVGQALVGRALVAVAAAATRPWKPPPPLPPLPKVSWTPEPASPGRELRTSTLDGIDEGLMP